MHSASQFGTFDELRDFIYGTMCQTEQLAVGAFPMTWKILKRGGELCGLMFSLQGPRSVFVNAVLATEDNAVHFYNSTGRRVLTKRVGIANSLTGARWNQFIDADSTTG